MSDDIVQTLDHLAESSRVLDQLRRLPRDRVDYLISVLEEPAAVQSLIRLLRTVQEIGREDRLQRQGPSLPFTPGDIDALGSSASGRELARDLPVLLAQLFADSIRFPTVRSISDFVQDAFRITVPHQRLNRVRYIKKVVNAVRRSPKALHFARNNMVHAPANTQDQAYSALYNFIRGRLTD